MLRVSGEGRSHMQHTCCRLTRNQGFDDVELVVVSVAEELANDEQVRRVYLGKHFELKRKV